MIIKVKPDKGKAKGMLKLTKMRVSSISILKKSGFSNIVAETYYEIIKELSSSFLLSKGFKSVGENFHRDLFLFMYKEKVFDSEEFFLVDDLRVRRNKSFYQGKEISKKYLDIKEKRLSEIIKKLEFLLDSELKDW